MGALPPPMPSAAGPGEGEREGKGNGKSKGITAKDLVGDAPAAPEATAKGGVMNWYSNRMKQQEEEQKVKMEKWQEVMAKRAKDKEDAARAGAKN